MPVTPSELRRNVYRILDRVAESGIAVEVVRKGVRLRIAPAEPVRKLDRLPRRPGILSGDPEDLVHLDWSETWNREPK